MSRRQWSKLIRRPRAIVPLIFLLALAVRSIALVEVRHAPMHQNLKGDAAAYDAWGQRIAAGEWIGGEVFYQAPLYPYFLGVIYSIAGHSLAAVHIVQIVLGSAACVLLWFAARVFFSDVVGALAGMMLALYPPAVFFDLLVEKTVLDSFLLCALLAAMAWIEVRPRAWRCAVAGVILGVMSLSRENALIFAPILIIWTIVLSARTGAGKARYATALIAGCVCVVFPIALRNTVIGREFHLTTAQLGPSFYIGNNATADGLYRPLRPPRGDAQFGRIDATELAEQAVGKKLSPRQVSNYWRRAALTDIAKNPSRALGLFARKVLLVFNAVEIADSGDVDTYIAWSNYLRAAIAVFHFGVLLPLAAAGIALTWDRRAMLWTWYAMSVAFALSTALFYLFARYRYPLVPLLIPFAAAALIEIPRLIRAGVKRKLLLPAAAALLAAIVSNMSLVIPLRIRGADWFNRGIAFASRGDSESAVESYRRALSINPSLADAHANLGLIYFERGKIDDAITHARRALTIDPSNAEAHHNLAMALASSGQEQQALHHLHQAVRLNPDLRAARANLAIALSRAGAYADAAQHLETLAAQMPDDMNVKIRLAQALVGLNRRGDAEQQFRLVLKLKLDWPPAQDALARLLATDPNASLQGAGEAIALASAANRATNERNPQMLDTLAAAYAQAGRFDEALAIVRRARSIAISTSDSEMVRRLERRVQLYQSRQPLREYVGQAPPATRLTS